jgi:hypothetical protein
MGKRFRLLFSLCHACTISKDQIVIQREGGGFMIKASIMDRDLKAGIISARLEWKRLEILLIFFTAAVGWVSLLFVRCSTAGEGV